MFNPGDVFQSVSQLRILKKIAQGGMGTIYLARFECDESFAKTVALKTINPEHTEKEHNVRLFTDEAKLVSDLIHYSIVQVYGLGKYQGLYYVFMEYVHGRNLKEFLTRHREMGLRVPVDVCTFIISRVCRGLHYAHTKRDPSGTPLGIVHRDITPTNILLDVNGFVKITDFGIAKALTMGIPDERKVVMGKLPYMSPEQAMAKGTDFRSDIFSTGLVLYELLTGLRVFSAKTRDELITKMTGFRIKPPGTINSKVPAAVDEIVMKALEPDPSNRYQSAMEFCVALEKYMYSDKYGPTNEKLALYFQKLFPEVDKHRII
jgi:serine/threonine-protein kinase